MKTKFKVNRSLTSFNFKSRVFTSVVHIVEMHYVERNNGLRLRKWTQQALDSVHCDSKAFCVRRKAYLNSQTFLKEFSQWLLEFKNEISK